MINKQKYLSKYFFNWEFINVLIAGRSSLDTSSFLVPMGTVEQVNHFLKGYGLNPNDPIARAELFGHFQEALQFIKKYFLKEGNLDGLDMTVPNTLYMITDVSELFLMATIPPVNRLEEEKKLWAEATLKVMHTILHVDKDLRSNYFSLIQTQIFDRFYHYVQREGDHLYLQAKGMKDDRIKLLGFETKAKKTRDSVIIKLLHKAENVAEELFDRIGVRFVVKTKFDTLRVVHFLLRHNIVIPHNIKPSRSVNTLFDLNNFREEYNRIIKMAIRNDLSEERFLQAINRVMNASSLSDKKVEKDSKNHHSKKSYQSIQFTCRQLIKYKDPLFKEFQNIRSKAIDIEGLEHREEVDGLIKKIMQVDLSLLARDVRFFYPYEVQIVDEDSHLVNTKGEASHEEYKKSQLKSARNRIFAKLIEFHQTK